PMFIVKGDQTLDLKLRTQHILTDWINRIEIFKKYVKTSGVVVIDSYLAKSYHYRLASKYARTCLFLDDYGRLKYPSGFVLNPSPGALMIKYPKKNGITYLLGPKYALLRKPFWKVGRKKISASIKKILIVLWPDEFGQKVVEVLHNQFPEIKKRLVQKQKKDRRILPNVKIYHGLSAEEIRTLISECDVAVSSGGQVTYELARIGIPSILVATADNQLINCKGWQKIGFALFAGWWRDNRIEEKIVTKIRELEDPEKRKRMSGIGRKTVDGEGAKRVIRRVLSEIDEHE
ncbi:MAG: UDP-2,4-diacetamido-2,4,6-trideoxy-beta-L-altropyranose hydrolase, partial [Candidatus Heimdallarchaeota archaeon]